MFVSGIYQPVFEIKKKPVNGGKKLERLVNAYVYILTCHSDNELIAKIEVYYQNVHVQLAIVARYLDIGMPLYPLTFLCMGSLGSG